MKLARAHDRGFTLIEIMLVVAIMAIVLTMGFPAINNMVHRAPFEQGIQDVMEGCRVARRNAILSGAATEFRIHPQDGRMEVVPAPMDAAPGATTPAAIPTDNGEPPRQSRAIKNFSAQLSLDHLRLEMVDVNFIEYKDQDEARVRFYPNGTSDEFTLVVHSDTGEYRKISLEVVTALAGVGPLR